MDYDCAAGDDRDFESPEISESQMNVADIIKAAESGFSSISTDSKREGIEISSGGNDVPGDANVRTEPAALYATEELALEAWLREFERSIDREGQSLVWIEKPYIETYRITLGDQHNSYRIVRDRYVARGRVAREAYVDDAVSGAAPEITPGAGASAATGGLTAPTEAPAARIKRKAKAA